MNRTVPTLRCCVRLMLVAAALGLTLWGTLALWYQAPSPGRWPLMGSWCALGLLASRSLALPRRRWRGAILMAAAIALLALLGWWLTMTPSHSRQWADDVARLLETDVDGSRLVMHNVRNFDWHTGVDYRVRWETRTYDLDRLVSADLILSYWMGPQIAHTLVSFGFDDGQRVVFSLEIRKERHEAFSAIGGFFREFEQVIVASDERDIVRTRSNVRGEDVYLYRLGLSREQLRTLLLGYVESAEALHHAPRFYNTVTSNCTTIIFELAQRISPGLPVDWRLLLSGHFAAYVYDHGGLAPGFSYERLREAGHINARALAADASGADFSTAIRQDVPGPSSRGNLP